MNSADSSSGNGTGIRDLDLDNILIGLAQAEHDRLLKGGAVADIAKDKEGRWLLPAMKKKFEKLKLNRGHMTKKRATSSRGGARSLEYIVTDGSGAAKKVSYVSSGNI
jgi:hypothetical protein